MTDSKEVPEGWIPEAWYRHLQNIVWLEAMGLHTSVTSPARNIALFKEKVIREFAENARTVRFDQADLREGAVLERAILKRLETVDLSKADLVILRSESTPEGIDQLVVAQLAKTLKAKRGQDALVLLMRPNEGVEAFSKDEVKDEVRKSLVDGENKDLKDLVRRLREDFDQIETIALKEFEGDQTPLAGIREIATNAIKAIDEGK